MIRLYRYNSDLLCMNGLMIRPGFMFRSYCSRHETHYPSTYSPQVPVIVCDYQVEVNLISYNNPQRRLQDGSCCDLESGGNCLPQDTCDVRLTFSVQNFATLMTFHDQTKVLGTYENSDMISFANCSTLTNNERNPLKFTIATNQWNMGVRLPLVNAQDFYVLDY